MVAPALGSLAERLLAAAGEAVRADAAGRPAGWLETRLGTLVDAARAALPGLGVESGDFCAWVGERLPGKGPLDEELDALNAADLLLACGLAQRDGAALARFEAEHFAEVGRQVAALGLSADRLDEARQITRILLLGGDGSRPVIASYSGRGPFKAWLRVTLSRELFRLGKRDRREAPLDDGQLGAEAMVGEDPEVAHLKRHYRAEFAQAFEAAVAGLDPGELRLLRYHYVNRYSIDEIGILSRVHRATAARRLVAAREALLAATRAALRARLRVDGNDLDSILRLIESQVAVSVRRIFRETDES